MNVDNGACPLDSSRPKKTPSSSALSSTISHVPFRSSRSHSYTSWRILESGSSRPGISATAAISRYPCSNRVTLLACTQNTHVLGAESRRRYAYSMAIWDFLMGSLSMGTDRGTSCTLMAGIVAYPTPASPTSAMRRWCCSSACSCLFLIISIVSSRPMNLGSR